MENNLLVVMSTEDILAIKAKYAEHPDVVAMVNAYLTKRQTEAEEEAILNTFGIEVEDRLNNPKKPLPHPSSIMNFLSRWAEVEVPNGKPEEIDVAKVTDGKTIMVREMRTPTTKVWKWVVEPNKGFTVSKASNQATSAAGASKRAITVKRISGDRLELVGNFINGKAACDHLHLDVGVNSAPRVLRDNKYLVEVYDGNDFVK